MNQTFCCLDVLPSRRMPNHQLAASRALSIRKKVLFAFVAIFACFLSAELLLATLGLPHTGIETDPYVGFSKHVSLLETFETTAGHSVYRTKESKLVWFNDQSFPLSKGENTFRIVCLGGSTTFGRPFDDRTAYSQWLRELLPVLAPDQDWEVINAGGVSYASYRIATVMEQFLDKDVDLFLLYCGQNEFLEWRTYGDVMSGADRSFWVSAAVSKTRLGSFVLGSIRKWGGFDQPSLMDKRTERLPGEVDEMLNHTIGPSSYIRDQAWARGVENHFRVSLNRIGEMAQSVDARLAVIRPVSNLRHCRPFKAGFSNSLDEKTTGVLLEKLGVAEQLFRDGRVHDCLGEIASIDEFNPVPTDLNADVEYLRAECLFRLEKFDEAAAAFQAAIDHDICPLRATSPIKEIILEFAALPGVIDVDAESMLQQTLLAQSRHTCLGEETFLDHVHPTIAAHGQIAVAIVNALMTAGLVERGPTETEVSDAASAVEAFVDADVQRLAYRNLAKVFHWSGKFDLAEARAIDALKLGSDDLESRFILADCHVHAGRFDDALQEYTELFERGEFDRALIPFAELLANQGHVDAAKAYLMQAIMVSPPSRQKMAYLMLGQLHFDQGERDLATECWNLAEQML